MVTFYFGTNTVFEYSREVADSFKFESNMKTYKVTTCREARMTMINYISQVGGLMGLCLGFSFLSAVELVYWFTYRLGQNL